MYIVNTIYHNLQIKNGPYQSFQKDPAIRIKAEAFKESKNLKDIGFNYKLNYCLKPAHLHLDFLVN